MQRLMPALCDGMAPACRWEPAFTLFSVVFLSDSAMIYHLYSRGLHQFSVSYLARCRRDGDAHSRPARVRGRGGRVSQPDDRRRRGRVRTHGQEGRAVGANMRARAGICVLLPRVCAPFDRSRMIKPYDCSPRSAVCFNWILPCPTWNRMPTTLPFFDARKHTQSTCFRCLSSPQLLFGLLAKGVSAADPATSHQMLTQVLAVLCNIGENSEAAINTIMQVRCMGCRASE